MRRFCGWVLLHLPHGNRPPRPSLATRSKSSSQHCRRCLPPHIATILHEDPDIYLDTLLQMEANGTWPPSPVLLAPDKDKPEDRGPAYSDGEQVHGTAVALMALKNYLLTQRQYAANSSRLPDNSRLL